MPCERRERKPGGGPYDVSVVVTCYRHEDYLERCLDSVMAQEGVRFEVIIGDDCSPDGTGAIAEAFRRRYPDRVRVLPRPENLGMQENLKDCLRHCRGEFVAICEGDDYWTDRRRLAAMCRALRQDRECRMCFTGIMLDMDGRLFPHFEEEKRRLPARFTAREVLFPVNLIANFSCCMYRRSALSAVPDSGFGPGDADLLFHLYLLDDGFGTFVDRCGSHYRIHGRSLWSGMGAREQFVETVRMAFRYDRIFGGRYLPEFTALCVDALDRYMDARSSPPRRRGLLERLRLGRRR